MTSTCTASPKQHLGLQQGGYTLAVAPDIGTPTPPTAGGPIHGNKVVPALRLLFLVHRGADESCCNGRNKSGHLEPQCSSLNPQARFIVDSNNKVPDPARRPASSHCLCDARSGQMTHLQRISAQNAVHLRLAPDCGPQCKWSTKIEVMAAFDQTAFGQNLCFKMFWSCVCVCASRSWVCSRLCVS